MNHLIFTLLFSITSIQNNMVIFDFKVEPSQKGWYIVNDGVMGGLSEGQFVFKNDQAVFKGIVSTRNNGGFTMVQNKFKAVVLDKYDSFVLRLKGDGKSYQFRVKSDQYTRYSYVFEFKTTGNWQEVTIPFSILEPRFRGRVVDLPNFDGSQIEEVAFLIGNKKNESFELQLGSIQAK